MFQSVAYCVMPDILILYRCRFLSSLFEGIPYFQEEIWHFRKLLKTRQGWQNIFSKWVEGG